MVFRDDDDDDDEESNSSSLVSSSEMMESEPTQRHNKTSGGEDPPKKKPMATSSTIKWILGTLLLLIAGVVGGVTIVFFLTKRNNQSDGDKNTAANTSSGNNQQSLSSTTTTTLSTTIGTTARTTTIATQPSFNAISAPTVLQSPATTTTLRYAEFVFQTTNTGENTVDVDFECSLDQGDFQPCESPVFYPDVGEGSHTFTVRSSSVSDDETGISANETRFSWQVTNLFDNGAADSHDDLLIATRQPSLAEPNSWRGIFRINCDLSHTSYNDPVVFPGVLDATHLHRFYGNTLVDHTSTMESIYTQGESTCQGNHLNRAAYWYPALLAPLQNSNMIDNENDDNWQVVPAVVGGDDVAHEVFYYSAGVDDLDSIQPIPAGLRMVAGDPTATPENPQDTSIVRWHCQLWESSDGQNPQWSTTIPECQAPDRVRMDIFFPSCWNGVDLDSPDHKAHMAYPIRQNGAVVCPSSHPVPVVRPSYHLAFGVKADVFDVATKSSKGWRLASDNYAVSDSRPGGASLHADWFNGWHPAVMEAILKHCIQSGLDCHDGNLANGYRLSDVQEGNTSDEIPEIVNSGRGYHVDLF